MDDQLSFVSLDFASKKRRTKRDVFLAKMGGIVPWASREALIDPYCPKLGPQGGRRPCQFGYRKDRYRGIAKRRTQVFALLALANLYLARGRLASA